MLIEMGCRAGPDCGSLWTAIEPTVRAFNPAPARLTLQPLIQDWLRLDADRVLPLSPEQGRQEVERHP